MPLRIIDYGSYFNVSFDFDMWFKRNLQAVKSLPYPKPRYVVDHKNGLKYWHVGNEHREEIMAWEVMYKAKVIPFDQIRPEEVGEVPPMAELTVKLPLKPDVVLRPYQEQGIAQAMKFERCLIGDEQGLGKTIQSIGTIVGLDAKPCIVVCPASTKINWQREFHKFSGYRALVLDSQKMTAQQKRNWHQYVKVGLTDVVIVNYESIANFFIEYYPQEKTKNGKKKPWNSSAARLYDYMSMFNSIIVDESHRLKDPATNQAKFVLSLSKNIKYRFLLSGTPVINKPIDLFPQLAILGRLNEFGGVKGYKERYCEGGSGASNMKELNYKLQTTCFFRREKKDVAKDLPDKQRQTVLCDITNRDEYNKAANDFANYLREKGCDDEDIARKLRGEIMVQMQQLKMIAGKGKMNEVKEFVNEILEADEKLILFCHLKSVVDECLRIWPDAVTVTGSDSMEARQENIDRFQKDPKCQLIVCNHKAAGVGITLTASSRVAFIEYPWTYADCVQCEDRAHRIGQKNNVMCTYFLGRDTIDEHMWEIIQNKMLVGNTITGATDMMDSMEMIDKTLNLFRA